MILKAEEIAAFLREGQKPKTQDPFVITPHPDYDELAKSGAASIDLCLGTWFASLREGRMSHLSLESVKPHSQIMKTHYVPFDREYFLHPKKFVLGITLEWIRLPRNLAAFVVGRSTWGRRGLIIATATGVHPGFKGCLTLELSNVGEIPIAIKPGTRICQLFIHRLSETGTEQVDQSQFIGLRKPELGDAKYSTIS